MKKEMSQTEKKKKKETWALRRRSPGWRVERTGALSREPRPQAHQLLLSGYVGHQSYSCLAALLKHWI